MTIEKISNAGYHLMRRENLHHHFFMDYSLYTTAVHLVLFALDFDSEKNQKNFMNIKITEKEGASIIHLFEKRIVERLPVEYITQESNYLGYKFYVNENVLVPRSVMNTRFDEFLQNVQWKNYRVLDLGTGSGCIGITLALMKSDIMVDLVDISEKALSVAAININRHQLQQRVKCIQSDLFEKIHETYDLIITNPPYVSCREYKKIPAEFKTEPKLALEAGKKGLDVLDQILMNASRYLNSQGTLIAEVGATAARHLKKKYPEISFKWLKYKRPSNSVSKFGSWIDRIFGVDCIFQCKAKELPVSIAKKIAE